MTTCSPTWQDGWGTTLAFWATLLISGTMFAAVSLAPRLATLAELQAEYAADQRRLVELERRADELERIARALEDDPAYATELAHVELALDRPGSQRIAVPDDLRLGAHSTAAAQPPDAPTRLAFAMPLIEPLAVDPRLRISLLGLASCLVVVAFALLNDSRAATVRAIAGRTSTFGRRFVARYRRCDSR